jgi:hypothetical protein
MVTIILLCEPGSSVSVVSGYGLDERTIEIRFPAEVKGFSSNLLCTYRPWGPPSLLYSGCPFRGAKARPGRFADHSPQYNAEAENE